MAEYCRHLIQIFMEKQTFIDCIEALDNQYKLDISKAELLAKVFKDSTSGNLLPDNHFVTNILIRILQEEFNDKNSHSWIEYYCYELDFGRENWRLKAYDENKKEIPLSNAEQLYNLLISKV